MHDLIKFLHPAVSRLPTAGAMGCYVFGKDATYASNHALFASAPFESDIEFNVPAAELDAALGRMKTVDDLAFKNGKLIIKGGRLRATIDTVDEEPPALRARSEAKTTPFPPTLQQALRLALPFTGDVGWAAGIRLHKDRVTAASNIRVIDITVPGLAVPIPVLLTKDTAQFLIDLDAPATLAIDGNNIECTWADGRWFQGQFLQGEFGGGIDKILASLGTDAPTPITDDWRAALEDGAALTDGTVRIDTDGISGMKGAGAASHEFPTGLSKPTHWSAAGLAPIFACATAWNPEDYPAPCLFVGPSLRGVIVGVKR